MKSEAITPPALPELPNAVQLGQEGTAVLSRLITRLQDTAEELIRWLTAWSVTSSRIDLPHTGVVGSTERPRRFG